MQVEYKIIGGDGAEYGPATLDELRGWIGDGRVAGSTQVWRNDIAHWLPAARYLELHPDLERLHASVTPGRIAADARSVGFWPRLGAYLIDRLVLTMLLGIMWVPLSKWLKLDLPAFPLVINQETAQQFLDQMKITVSIMFPFLVCGIVLYDVLLNGTFGATLGKMSIGARIVRANGERLGYRRALLRSLAGQLTEMLFYWGYLWVAFRRDKRGMHDFIAGTRVIYP